MLALITGGSGSGKSEYAEELVCSLGDRRVYLATMKAADDESRSRILRHRKQRAGRMFTTIERPDDIGGIALPPDPNVLLEDMGNLLANIMFGRAVRNTGRDIADAVISDIEKLEERCLNLVIVTNDVFSDGRIYDEDTESYMKTLALVNREIAVRSDFAAEIVCGLPNVLKETL